MGARSIEITNGNDATQIATRGAAQGRIDQIEIFERELAQLRADRVIQLTDSQLRAITAYHRHIIHELTARYDADASDSGRQLSMTLRIVSVIGAFLLGSTVFVFFYHFWAAFNVIAQTFSSDAEGRPGLGVLVLAIQPRYPRVTSSALA